MLLFRHLADQITTFFNASLKLALSLCLSLNISFSLAHSVRFLLKKACCFRQMIHLFLGVLHANSSPFLCGFGVMGDHFVLLVDRLLTESTLEAAIESINHGSSMPLPTLEADYSPTKKIIGDGVFTGKMVECRICQDEDEDIHMEIPCSCCGSLKFAHRKCVQKWCNEKGDTTCEICLQQFEPGYTAPPKLFLYGTTPMHFRGNWEVSRQNIHNQQSLTMAQTEHVFLRPTDDYAGLSDRSIIYCRIAATTFMIILVLWHSLTFITDETEQCSILLLALLLLKIVGIVLPIYVTMRALSIFYQHKLQAMYESSISASQIGNQHPHPSQRIQP